MSTPFERLNDPSNFDDKGMMIPKTDTTATDGDQSATPPAKAEEPTAAAAQPSPDTVTAKAGEPAKPEDQSGQQVKPAATADDGKTQLKAAEPAKADEEETEDQLKAKYSKPEDTKGDEWRMRLYRDAMKMQKRNTPWQSHLDTINSSERVSRGLDFTAVFAEPDQDIATAVQKLTALSASRTADLRDFLDSDQLDRFPDNVARDLLEDTTVTVAELKEALAAKRGGATGHEKPQPQSTATAPTEVQKPEGMTDDEWDDFKVDYPKAFEAMQKAHSAASQTSSEPAKPAEPPVDPKVTELETKVKGYEDKEREGQIQAAQEKMLTEGKRISDEAETVVSARLRELGLEPDTAKDDDRTVKLKERTANAIQQIVWNEFDGEDGPKGWTDFSKCSPEQAENRRLQVKIIDLLAKDDVTAARDYIEHLKARVELTLERIADQIQGEVEVFNAAMLQPATRNAQGEQRPEIRSGTAATDGASKTPWLDPGFKKPGETAFAAMSRYMETATALPGRQ